MKKQYIHPLRRQLGMTLIELIAALGVAAVVIVGALALYKNADESQKSNEMLSGVTAVRGAIRQLYGGQYGTDTSVNFVKAVGDARRLPAGWNLGADNKVKNVFGEVQATAEGTDSTLMKITLNNIPSSVCSAVATGVQGWTRVKAGDAAELPYPLSPTNVATITTGCNTGAFVTLTLTGT